MAARNEPNLSSSFFFFTRDPVNRLTKRYTQAWFRRNDGIPIRYRFETRVSLLIKHGGRGGKRVVGLIGGYHGRLRNQGSCIIQRKLGPLAAQQANNRGIGASRTQENNGTLSFASHHRLYPLVIFTEPLTFNNFLYARPGESSQAAPIHFVTQQEDTAFFDSSRFSLEENGTDDFEAKTKLFLNDKYNYFSSKTMYFQMEDLI